MRCGARMCACSIGITVWQRRILHVYAVLLSLHASNLYSLPMPGQRSRHLHTLVQAHAFHFAPG